MPHSVLIATVVGDLHAHAVAVALQQRGVDTELWYTSDFPATSKETYKVSPTGAPTLAFRGPELALSNPEPDVVWNRRVGFEVPFERLARSDRYFAELEAKAFRDGSMALLAPDAFWVNPWREAHFAKSKLFQLQLARSVDFNVPETLCTNDPDAVRSLIDKHGDEIIYKPFRGVPWNDGESSWGCYTTVIREEDLVSDQLLTAVPGIYQEKIEKTFELRVTMIGQRAFAARIDSQDTRKGKVDWRLAYDEITMAPFKLPEDWLERCRSLLNAMGLVFGCIDFIVTPDGKLVFLEINEQGQFLFIERYCDLPVLDAFVSLLSTGSPKYDLPSEKPVAFVDVVEQAQAAVQQSTKIHRELRSRAAKERPVETP